MQVQLTAAGNRHHRRQSAWRWASPVVRPAASPRPGLATSRSSATPNKADVPATRALRGASCPRTPGEPQPGQGLYPLSELLRRSRRVRAPRKAAVPRPVSTRAPSSPGARASRFLWPPSASALRSPRRGRGRRARASRRRCLSAARSVADSTPGLMPSGVIVAAECCAGRRVRGSQPGVVIGSGCALYHEPARGRHRKSPGRPATSRSHGVTTSRDRRQHHHALRSRPVLAFAPRRAEGTCNRQPRPDRQSTTCVSAAATASSKAQVGISGQRHLGGLRPSWRASRVSPGHLTDRRAGAKAGGRAAYGRRASGVFR